MNHLTHFAPAGILAGLAAVLAFALVSTEPVRPADAPSTYVGLPVGPLDTFGAVAGDPLSLAKIASFNPANADALGAMLEADMITEADAEEAADLYQNWFEWVETGHSIF